MPAGIYFITLKTNLKTFTTKIIIN
ncbi:MAG: T9SS type A sorting domain-containing protein [Bacteroidetes bacterium]|nr:T9SS type A sorting domain-containing protein [Bacteroidota bacterium]